MSISWSLCSILAVVVALSACASRAKQSPPVSSAPLAPSPAPYPGLPRVSPLPAPEVLPPSFESTGFVVVSAAKSGDTVESLATRYLGSPAKGWMIEDYLEARSFTEGQEVVIPQREWNPPGVYPSGYQLVPVLVYHNIAPQRKGRLAMSATTFEEQMRYLKSEGYHAVRFQDFLAHLRHGLQLPRKSVVLSFDDGHKAFLQYAHPLLKELGFAAVLFITTDQISSRPNPSVLSWQELRELAAEGIEVQAHSKTHGDLRRTAEETEAAYARRMQTELGEPLDLLRKQVPRPSDRLEAVAYPYGEWDEDLLRSVRQHGYSAGFTVRRQANPAFVPLLKVNRSQVYSEWTLDEFKKNLNTFQREKLILSEPTPEPPTRPMAPPSPAGARRDLSPRERLAALHNDRAERLESVGSLRQAIDERTIALTIDPADSIAQERRKGLEDRIENAVAAHLLEGQRLARWSPTEASRHFLAALALNPTSHAAFEGLRNAAPPVRFLTHTVRPQDTLASLADLYYGDRSRADVIQEANRLQPGVPLPSGRPLRIPEIPGVPFLRPDR
jgi:peptidoglycan/xylan/chitin deacetylase (PgdA/CDA1 family)